MGTNFYLGDAVWDVDAHIGKRSAAGGGLCSFSLQGHRETDFGPLVSWSQWRAVIRAVGHVTNEYRVAIPAEEFIAEVELTTMVNRRRQFDWMLNEHGYICLESPTLEEILKHDRRTTMLEWLCPDGFSFGFQRFT